MNYSHFQHRHNFAVWCAARAVQRNFTKSPVLKEAIEKSGVVEFIRQSEDSTITQEEFDKLHSEWCESILETWENKEIEGGSYGRAAKLIAVYIKSMVVVKNEKAYLSEVAHPPIDRILLQNISKDGGIQNSNRKYWKAINWTDLDKTCYLELIGDFREVFLTKPFWHLEQYWTISDD